MADGDFQTVSIYDPAIDYEATSAEAFSAFLSGEKRDRALLKMRSGEEPTVYTLREIPDDVFDRFVSTQTTQEQQFAAAFRCAVLRVDRGVDRHGKPMPHPWRPAALFGGEGPRDSLGWVLTAEEVREFDRPTVQEIGGVAYSRSVFCFRGKVRRWLLPPLSREIFEAVHSRSRAGQDMTSAAASGTSSTQPASPHAAPITTATDTTVSPSAAPGDAPAMDSHT